MNKVFKVIWNKSKNCYVVVSEFAKNNSGKKKIVAAGIFAALAITNASMSMASNEVPASLNPTSVGYGSNASVNGAWAVGLGKDVKVNTNSSVGIGYNANAATEESVAIGKDSLAQGNTTIAIGTNAKVKNSKQGIAIGAGRLDTEGAIVEGDQSIAIGGNTKAIGDASVVIGGDDTDKANAQSVVYTDINSGRVATSNLQGAVKQLTGFDLTNPRWTTATSGHAGITLGMKGQSGNASIAIGTGANAKDRIDGSLTGVNTGNANTDVTNAVAIGTGAKANRDNSVALGGGSTTDSAGTKQTSYTLPNGITASWAGGDKTLPGDVVSFGSAGYERQLKNVAPGEVSATSTDAINGSQLSAIVDQIAYKYVSVKSNDAGNIDNTGAKANNSIAIGPNASTIASAEKSVVIGDGSRALTANGVAIGSNSVADIVAGVKGYDPADGRTDNIGVMHGATQTSKMAAVSVGAANQTRQIVYVAAGTADTDAVNVAQLKSVNLAFTGDSGSGDVNLAESKLAVNGDNTYIATSANGKKITIAGKKQDITVANGTAIATVGMADAANVADAINTAIDQNKYSWNLSANGESTPATIEKGNTVDFSGDDNITVARNNNNISVALKKDLSSLNSASFTNTAGNSTVTIDGNTGINAGNLKITNVADGVADKDAVNVSQLKQLADKVDSNKADIDANKDNIDTNKANIAKNTQAIGRKISLGGNTGSTTEKSLSAGDVKFNIKGANGLTTVANGEDVTVQLDDATVNKINNAADTNLSNITAAGKQQVKDLAAWNVVANGNAAEKVEGGNTVKFIDGDNIAITQNGRDFTIATKKDVTFNSVTADTVSANQTITAPTVKATNGVETPQVTGLTNTDWIPGQTQPISGRAATEDQLKKVDDQVKTNKEHIATNTRDIAVNKSKIAANEANIADNTQKITDNKTAIDQNKVDIKANKDNIVTNTANIAKNTEAIGRKISLGGNTGSTTEKSLSAGDVKFNIKGENGLTTVASGNDVTIRLDDSITNRINNVANTDLSNLTDAGKQQVKGLSAWNITSPGGTVESVQGGDTVRFQAGDNLVLDQDKTTFTYSLSKDVKGLNSVTVGSTNGPSTKITDAGTMVRDAAGNTTLIRGTGMTFIPADRSADPVSLTATGLVNGGHQIHGVAPGTADSDAVNVAQLKASQLDVRDSINRIGTETQRVGAHAAAMAALKPIQYDPLEPTQIMAGIGNYRGETAGALGIAHYKTEDTMFNVGVTLGSNHNMINAGVTHKFGGSRERKDAIPERYKAGPISSIYVMQDEVTQLRSENEQQKSKLDAQQLKIDQQQSEINDLKAMVSQLLTKLS